MNKCAMRGWTITKRAFTLIELLAVIVILAIIALIAVPIVLNIINNSRNSARERSAELYVSAVEKAVIKKQMANIKVEPGEYTVDGNGNACLTATYISNSNSCPNNDNTIVVEISGEIPKAGSTFTLSSKNTVTEASFTISTTTLIIDTNGNFVVKPPVEQICELQEGTSKTVGAKYTCHLDEDRTFYVLEDGDNTTLEKGITGVSKEGELALIMDTNFEDEIVPWRMAYCDPNGNNPYDNACNHDGLDVYLNHIKEKFGNSVEVNLPSYDLLRTSGVYGSWWLFLNAGGTKGYWTKTPSTSSTNAVYCINTTYGTCAVTIYASNGIRPVITISKADLN